jgi:hypothetical protein
MNSVTSSVRISLFCTHSETTSFSDSLRHTPEHSLADKSNQIMSRLSCCFHRLLTETRLSIMDMIEYQSKEFWYAYLTHWGQMVTFLYFEMSVSTVILFHVVQEEPLNFMTRFTWGIFTAIVTAESMIMLLYWTLEYQDGEMKYTNFMKHGGFLLLLWIDGFVINRIPIRFKQIVWAHLFFILYLLWSIIHSVSRIGNPYRNDNDPTTDDDAIYSSVSWIHRPAVILITCIFLMTFLFRCSFLSIGFFQH